MVDVPNDHIEFYFCFLEGKSGKVERITRTSLDNIAFAPFVAIMADFRDWLNEDQQAEAKAGRGLSPFSAPEKAACEKGAQSLLLSYLTETVPSLSVAESSTV